MKHNVFQSDLSRYAPLQGQGNRFFAYGLNAGGVKLEDDYETGSTFLVRGGQTEQIQERLQQIRQLLPGWNTAFVRPPVKTMNHLGLIYAVLNKDLHGLILGVSSVAQILETLDFLRNLETFDYSDVWKKL